MRNSIFHGTMAAVVMAGVLLAPAVILAHPGHGEGPGADMRRLNRVAMLADVEFTEAQRQAIRAIFKEERASLKQQREVMRRQMRQLRAKSPEDPDYLEAVEEAANHSAEIARATVRNMGRIRYRIFTEVGLSDAQKLQLDSARDRLFGSMPESEVQVDDSDL